MPKKVDLTVEAMVLTLYRGTKNISEVARKVNLHRHTVRKILDRHGIFEDSTIKALREESDRLERMREKKKAYQKYRSQIELKKRELLGDKKEGRMPTSIHTFLEKSRETTQARTVVINLLRELERLAPRSFRNVCVSDGISHDEIINLMWDSGKMSRDTGGLLGCASECFGESFEVACENFGIDKDDVPSLVKAAKEEEFLYGRL